MSRVTFAATVRLAPPARRRARAGPGVTVSESLQCCQRDTEIAAAAGRRLRLGRLPLSELLGSW